MEVSILLAEFLDSHENGPASFLGGGTDAEGSGGALDFTAGDEAHGRLANRCVRRGGSGREAGVGAGKLKGASSGAAISFEVIVVDRDLLPAWSGLSSSCTSSRDDVDIRRAVSSGDLTSDTGPGSRVLASLESACMFPSTVLSIVGGWKFEGRGVVTASPVNDLSEAEETGREVVSGASSNESCSRSELSALDIFVSFSAMVVLNECSCKTQKHKTVNIPPLLLPQAKCPNHHCRDMLQGLSGPRMDTRRASNGARFGFD